MRKVRKIAIYSKRYYPILGGTIIYADLVAEELCKLGYEVKLITLTKGTNEKKVQSQKGFEITRVDSWLDVVREAVAYHLLITIDVPFHIGALFRVLTINKVWIATLHGPPPHGIVGMAQRITGRMLAKICSPSEYLSKRWGTGEFVGNPYNKDVFHIFNESEEFVSRPFDLIFAGRFELDKGSDYLFEIIENLVKARGVNYRYCFVIALDESQKSDVEKQITQKMQQCGVQADTFEVYYNLSQLELAVLYNRSKVFVFPSICQEGFGLVVLEALACGCRIVANDVGGVRSAGRQLARYVPVGDVDNFANKVIEEVAADIGHSKKSLDTILRKYEVSSVVNNLLNRVQ